MRSLWAIRDFQSNGDHVLRACADKSALQSALKSAAFPLNYQTDKLLGRLAEYSTHKNTITS